jgi:hypothetical protein
LDETFNSQRAASGNMELLGFASDSGRLLVGLTLWKVNCSYPTSIFIKETLSSLNVLGWGSEMTSILPFLTGNSIKFKFLLMKKLKEIQYRLTFLLLCFKLCRDPVFGQNWLLKTNIAHHCQSFCSILKLFRRFLPFRI